MQRVREFLRDILRQTDLVLLALCCTATAYGILMIYSATRYMETLRLVLVQTGGAVVGIILFFLLSLVDISELMRKKGWLWLTLFGLGMTFCCWSLARRATPAIWHGWISRSYPLWCSPPRS